MASTAENLLEGVRREIQLEADRMREIFIRKAVEEYEKKLRECISREAISIAKYYTIDTRNGEIVITVRHS